MYKRIILTSMDYPKSCLITVLLLTLVIGFQISKIQIDTDPENMLSESQQDRVQYQAVKKEFGIRDLIVFGITDSDGIYQRDTLEKVSHIIDGITRISGVITDDIISLTTTNNVYSSAGLLEIRRIMQQIPESAQDIEAIKKSIADNPLLTNKLSSASDDGLAIYIPIVNKDQAVRIANEIEIIAETELAGGNQKIYLAGLPLAEDQFGAEMFRQMGIMAPLSGAAILLLLWLFFRKMTLILPVMAVAMLTVVWGMGLLIGSGFTVHIMSSMIPVFLMPIAVIDSVHILSNFYDRYPKIQDRRKTLLICMNELHKPMLYTSLTSAAGFASLMLADIPPVQVFGGFVAAGIMIAWLLSIIFIPASIILLNENKLQKAMASKKVEESFVSKILLKLGKYSIQRSSSILLICLAVFFISIWGITKTVVDDNPVNWFEESSKIRIADRELNQRFGGTYMAYLVFEGQKENDIKRPDVLTYIENIQQFIDKNPVVGKTSSLSDIVKQVNYVVHDSDPKYRVIPDTEEELAQYLFLYQMSGDSGDLDNFVSYEFDAANIWIQMKKGDNALMSTLIDEVQQYISANPLPNGIGIKWSGLTYLNKVWQDLMVVGMLKAIMGGFLVVFILMVILMRSFLFGFIAMLPLTVSITFAYGLLGFVGKNYDMPIAVVSSLALGLSIDFAIHFIQRYRDKISTNISRENALQQLFGETSHAIYRNTVIISLGFLPMVLSSLGPYKTVGVFFALLMLVSSVVTLIVLPGLLKFHRPKTSPTVKPQIKLTGDDHEVITNN